MHTLDRWLAGEDHHVLAPFVAPDGVLPAGRPVVVLLGSDLAAMAWAASVGAGLILRTTARADRARALGPGAGSSVVVSSVDSLHSPILRKELSLARPGVPWLAWDADRMANLHPDNAGHGAWVERHREACRGAGLLWRHADRRLAPAGSEALDAPSGALLRVEPGQPGPLLRLSRGVLVGPAAVDDQLGHRLGEAGVARRAHDLRRLQRRPWLQADRALRTEPRGVDVFAADPGLLPGRAQLRTVGAAVPSDLAVPSGSVLGQAPGKVEVGAPITPELISRLRLTLAEHGTSRWLAVAGDAPGITAELMADLAAVGMLEALRPTQLAARVSEQHRFRPPRVDREPEYRALHDDYQAAMGGLSLTERVRFALTDRAPQDLRGLAARLGRDPASIADLLVTMDDDGLVTAFGEPLGGELDWQAVRGPRWDAEPDELAAAVTELRAARAEAVDRAAAVLAAREGCRVQLLASALGLAATEPCGRCDLCDPEGTSWPATVATSAAAPQVSPAPQKQQERATPSLHSLFAGLGSGTTAAGSDTPAWTAEELAEALLGSDTERLDQALTEAGSPVLLWIRSAWTDATPGRTRSIRAEEADALVQLLIEEAGPGTPSPRGNARRLPNGVVEIRLQGGGVGTSRRFIEGPSVWELLGPAADREQPPAALTALRTTRAGRAAWDAWTAAGERSVVTWLDQNPGLPDVSALLPPVPEAVAGDSAWTPSLAAITAASSGELDVALEALPDVPGAEVVETLLLAALREWKTLWEATLEASAHAPAPGGLVSRLEGRALLGLDPMPPLEASIACSWLRWADEELGPESVPVDRIVEAVSGGAAPDFVALARRAPDVAVAARAVAVGELPEKLVGAALQQHALVDVLAAVGDAESRAAAVWKQHAAGLPAPEQRELVAALRGRSTAMAAAGAAHLARLEEAVAHRQRVLDLAADGRLVEVLPLLAGLEARDPELDAVRAAVARAQRRYTEPLALALSGPGHDDAAWGALKQANADGWLDPMVLVLRVQARRHPEDGRRALWLARALAVAGRWYEASAQFSEAAALEEGQPEALEREFEGLDLALEAGKGRIVGEWLVRLVRSRRTRALAREITTRLWADKLPAEACELLQAELTKDGSGLYAGALRALQDKRRR